MKFIPSLSSWLATILVLAVHERNMLVDALSAPSPPSRILLRVCTSPGCRDNGAASTLNHLIALPPPGVDVVAGGCVNLCGSRPVLEILVVNVEGGGVGGGVVAASSLSGDYVSIGRMCCYYYRGGSGGGVGAETLHARSTRERIRAVDRGKCGIRVEGLPTRHGSVLGCHRERPQAGHAAARGLRGWLQRCRSRRHHDVRRRGHRGRWGTSRRTAVARRLPEELVQVSPPPARRQRRPAGCLCHDGLLAQHPSRRARVPRRGLRHESRRGGGTTGPKFSREALRRRRAGPRKGGRGG